MTLWESFVRALEAHGTAIILVLLLTCIVGLIRALTRREHDEGGGR